MIRYLRRTEPLVWPLLACLTFVFSVTFTYNSADPDLWGHIRYGMDTLAQRQLYQSDPYSYLTGDYRWFNHELLSELTFGAIYPRFGSPGLILWKWFMGLLTVGCIVLTHRHRRFKAVTLVLISALVAVSLRVGWVVRPQIYTYTFVSLYALLITEHQRGRSWPLWVAPAVMLLWVNAHGGFLVGLGVLAVHVCFSLVKLLRQRRSNWLPESLLLCLVMLATTVAPLGNPYGPELLDWLWEALTLPRPEISEWAPVPLWSLDMMSFKSLRLLGTAAVLGSRRPRRFNQLAILVLVAWQAIIHIRHIPIFAILAAHFLPEHLDDCLRRILACWAKRQRLTRADAGGIRMYRFILFALTLLLGTISVAHACSIRVQRASYPVSAFRFIRAHGLEGRMVTDFDWGQYCLYTFWPEILVSVDGRFRTAYPRKILDINLDFMVGQRVRGRRRSPDTGPFQADRILDLENPNLALVNRNRELCAQTIARHPDWVLLYQDALAQLWGRRSIYDNQASPDYIPPSARIITNDPQFGAESFPAAP